MRLTLSEPLNILWQMCSLQSGTDDIEENDADNAFHNKARNLSRTGIDAAVKNGAADEIADTMIMIPTMLAAAVRSLNMLTVRPVRLAI